MSAHVFISDKSQLPDPNWSARDANNTVWQAPFAYAYRAVSLG